MGSVDVAVNDGLLEGERVGIIVGSVDDASNDGASCSKLCSLCSL